VDICASDPFHRKWHLTVLPACRGRSVCNQTRRAMGSRVRRRDIAFLFALSLFCSSSVFGVSSTYCVASHRPWSDDHMTGARFADDELRQHRLSAVGLGQQRKNVLRALHILQETLVTGGHDYDSRFAAALDRSEPAPSFVGSFVVMICHVSPQTALSLMLKFHGTLTEVAPAVKVPLTFDRDDGSYWKALKAIDLILAREGTLSVYCWIPRLFL